MFFSISSFYFFFSLCLPLYSSPRACFFQSLSFLLSALFVFHSLFSPCPVHVFSSFFLSFLTVLPISSCLRSPFCSSFFLSLLIVFTFASLRPSIFFILPYSSLRSPLSLLHFLFVFSSPTTLLPSFLLSLPPLPSSPYSLPLLFILSPPSFLLFSLPF